MILADTSGILCLLDSGEADHANVRACVERLRGPLLTIDPVLAETDYLVLRRLGPRAERKFLAQLVDGAIVREPLAHEDLERALEIVDRYADQELGLTDSALMAVAERLGAPVLTLDRRHFQRFRDRRGKALELLPS